MWGTHKSSLSWTFWPNYFPSLLFYFVLFVSCSNVLIPVGFPIMVASPPGQLSYSTLWATVLDLSIENTNESFYGSSMKQAPRTLVCTSEILLKPQLCLVSPAWPHLFINSKICHNCVGGTRRKQLSPLLLGSRAGITLAHSCLCCTGGNLSVVWDWGTT
jgi:hypothetical protein